MCFENETKNKISMKLFIEEWEREREREKKIVILHFKRCVMFWEYKLI